MSAPTGPPPVTLGSPVIITSRATPPRRGTVDLIVRDGIVPDVPQPPTGPLRARPGLPLARIALDDGTKIAEPLDYVQPAAEPDDPPTGAVWDLVVLLTASHDQASAARHLPAYTRPGGGAIRAVYQRAHADLTGADPEKAGDLAIGRVRLFLDMCNMTAAGTLWRSVDADLLPDNHPVRHAATTTGPDA